MNNKTIFRALCVVLLALTIFSGCASKTPSYTSSKSMQELADGIRDSVEFSLMMGLQPEEMEDATGVKADLFSEVAVYVPMRMGSDSLIVGKLAEGVTVEQAEEALKAYQDNMIKTFETYLPEAYEMAKNGQIVKRGDYVMLVISPDNDTAVKQFEEAIQAK